MFCFFFVECCIDFSVILGSKSIRCNVTLSSQLLWKPTLENSCLRLGDRSCCRKSQKGNFGRTQPGSADANTLVFLKMLSAYNVCYIYSDSHVRLLFIMEEKTMNPYQTASYSEQRKSFICQKIIARVCG